MGCEGCRYNGQYPNVTAGWPSIDFSREYHTFAVEWNAEQISWFVDDNFIIQAGVDVWWDGM